MRFLKPSAPTHFFLPILLVAMLGIVFLFYQEQLYQQSVIDNKAMSQVKELTQILITTEAAVGDQVKGSMALLKELSLSKGAIQSKGVVHLGALTVPNLLFGQEAQSARSELVDKVARLMGGTVTIFVKSDQDFIRIATNLVSDKGDRYIGTMLDRNGKAILALRQGLPFYGVVDILGTPYITGYEPMLDMHGQLVGAWYVGYRADMETIQGVVNDSTFLKSGFQAVLDSNNSVRFHSQAQTHLKVVHLLNTRPQSWAFVDSEIPDWGYKVITAYPKKEGIAAGLQAMSKHLLLLMLFLLVLLYLMFRQMKYLVYLPLGGSPSEAVHIVHRIAAGDLSHEHTQAPTGSLLHELTIMCGKLRMMIETITKNADEIKLASAVFTNSHNCIAIWDIHGNFIDVNPAFTLHTGYARLEVLGKNATLFQSSKYNAAFYQQVCSELIQHGRWSGEFSSERKDGERYIESLTITAVEGPDNKASHYIGIATDITQYTLQQQALEMMAHYDPLTELPNRILFFDRFTQAIARSNREGVLLAVCYIDLDGFKAINDSLGHEAGDQLLVQVSARIKSILREDDTLSRLGGDEFALLLCNFNRLEQCEQTLARIHAVIGEPYELEGQSVQVSASTGFTIYPLDQSDQDTLLRHADQAMYQAKNQGRNRYLIFDAELGINLQFRRQTLNEVDEGLVQGQFCLHYQPKVDMATQKVLGVEALIRWQHPQRGLLAPLAFLPLIEGTSHEISVGNWVIAESLRQLDTWHKQGIKLEVSINISSRHLQHKNLLPYLSGKLAEYPACYAQYFQLEIVESSIFGDIAALSEIIRRCNLELGISVALDDFGTGYSSLSHMRHLPVKVIKIDHSFVRNMIEDAADYAIVRGVLALASAFGLAVVAEGVESIEHGRLLLSLGCQVAQGYDIARPMPAEKIAAWIDSYGCVPQDILS